MARADRTLRGRVAVVGIGETEYYRHAASPDPEFKLALRAILADLPTPCLVLDRTILARNIRVMASAVARLNVPDTNMPT